MTIMKTNQKSENIDWIEIIKIVWKILGVIIEVLTGQTPVTQGKAKAYRLVDKALRTRGEDV